MINGSATQLNNSVFEKYCYDNDQSKCETHGGLYQWGEMMDYNTSSGAQGLCPVGWHVPSDNEWCTLEQYVDPTIICNSTGSRGIDGGGHLKETGINHWLAPNSGATNSTGFSAIPNGYNDNSGFEYAGLYGYWWSSTSYATNRAWLRHLYYDTPEIRRDYIYQVFGFSVRCLKND
jgi:uncharacterized protein (TIGR02145 family)